MANGASKSRSGRLRVVVLGMVVRVPLGGLTWHYLQYLVGLGRLGHDVYYVEDSCFFESDEVGFCWNPIGSDHGDPTYGLRYTADVFTRTGFGDRWAYYDGISRRWHGPCADRIEAVCASADVVINVSGVNPLRPWLLKAPARLYIDTDPLFNQIKQVTNSINRHLADQHTSFLTFGESICTGHSRIPATGHRWRATRQPIVLDLWPVTPAPEDGRFTAVMAWEGYRRIEYRGVQYGLKAESFTALMRAPQLTAQKIELALAQPTTAPIDELQQRGWIITDAREPTRDPWMYREFLQRSKAELGVAKEAYVVSRSGWFSERSANYLASGRPVLAQETGFSEWMATGAGVIPFDSLEGAIAGIETINSRYAFHCKAARDVAAAYFDSREVLTRLLEAAFDTEPDATAPSSSTAADDEPV